MPSPQPSPKTTTTASTAASSYQGESATTSRGRGHAVRTPFRLRSRSRQQARTAGGHCHADNDVPIICNGFKDDRFIETALLAQKIGRQIFIVVEKFTELELVLHYSEQLGVRPTVGMRVKLAACGAGRWQSSGGHRSKFGLTVSEVLRALDLLKDRDMADCFQLLHFHIGSQVTNIRRVKAALNEAARIYTDLARNGAGLQYLDVGGGLGVDYDGSQTNFESSVNYTLQEYANDVIYHVQTVCDDAEVPHPTIFSESGRAVVAYHSVLVFDVLASPHALTPTRPTSCRTTWSSPCACCSTPTTI